MQNSSADHEDAHEEEEEGEPWLVSYADLMTLLFGFFVLMYTFAVAKLDPEGANMVKLRREVASYFGGEFLMPYEEVVKSFRRKLADTDTGVNIKTKHTPEGVEITFNSTVLFQSGSAKLSTVSAKYVNLLISEIAKNGTNVNVTVQGHTDDLPIRTSKIFPSNWELSSSRAGTVIRIFESLGFAPSRLTAVGYGSSRPLAPNRSEDGVPLLENQAKNRRVTIQVRAVNPVPSRQ